MWINEFLKEVQINMSSPLEEAFFDFWESQGVKFVDADTGQRIVYENGKIVRKEEDENEHR